MSLMLGGLANAANPEWNLKKSRDGITAYTAKLENNDHLAFKGEAVIPAATLEQTIAVIRDVTHLDQWLYTCYEPKLLKDEDEHSSLIYMKNHTPTFFVAERDLVLRLSVEREADGLAHITLTGLPDAMPEVKSYVRVPYFLGKWDLEQVPEGVRAIYSGVIDPGGGLPATISNMMVVDTPFETLKNLVAFMAR